MRPQHIIAKAFKSSFSDYGSEGLKFEWPRYSQKATIVFPLCIPEVAEFGIGSSGD
jgi:hypothetical protein